MATLNHLLVPGKATHRNKVVYSVKIASIVKNAKETANKNRKSFSSAAKSRGTPFMSLECTFLAHNKINL